MSKDSGGAFLSTLWEVETSWPTIAGFLLKGGSTWLARPRWALCWALHLQRSSGSRPWGAGLRPGHSSFSAPVLPPQILSRCLDTWTGKTEVQRDRGRGQQRTSQEPQREEGLHLDEASELGTVSSKTWELGKEGPQECSVFCALVLCDQEMVPRYYWAGPGHTGSPSSPLSSSRLPRPWLSQAMVLGALPGCPLITQSSWPVLLPSPALSLQGEPLSSHYSHHRMLVPQSVFQYGIPNSGSPH